MKPFIIVYGAPRTGTSLTCELVKACGYNLGKTERDANPRRGYNEHPMTSQLPERTSNKAVRRFLNGGLNCAKVIGFPKNIDRLIDMGERVKVILTHRQLSYRQSSATNMLKAISKGADKLKLQNKVLKQRDKWVKEHPDLDYLNVSFEDLIEKKGEVLQSIVDFCESTVDIDELKKVINPDQVKFK